MFYQVGSGLLDPTHNDMNSVLTIVIMLSSPHEFDDGEFQRDGTILVHSLQRGDAICFVSHKYHSMDGAVAGRQGAGIKKYALLYGWQWDCWILC